MRRCRTSEAGLARGNRKRIGFCYGPAPGEAGKAGYMRVIWDDRPGTTSVLHLWIDVFGIEEPEVNGPNTWKKNLSI